MDSDAQTKADQEWLDRPSGIEFHGVAGASHECQTAVVRLLMYGPPLKSARIVTAGRSHCLLLTNGVGDVAAVRSGFGSGYGGTGPSVFSFCLQLLLSHDVEIDECEVDEEVLDRIDRAQLTVGELEAIDQARPIRPSRWYDYISKHDEERAQKNTLWQFLRPTMPYALIEPRLIDLALVFSNDPDAALSRGYRRLEDIVRARTGLNESNTRLFAETFNGKEPKLTWKVDDPSEKVGRSNLFIGTFAAFRNPRAHREKPSAESLTEFLLLNQLYLLEAEAVPPEESTA